MIAQVATRVARRCIAGQYYESGQWNKANLPVQNLHILIMQFLLLSKKISANQTRPISFLSLAPLDPKCVPLRPSRHNVFLHPALCSSAYTVAAAFPLLPTLSLHVPDTSGAHDLRRNGGDGTGRGAAKVDTFPPSSTIPPPKPLVQVYPVTATTVPTTPAPATHSYSEPPPLPLPPPTSTPKHHGAYFHHPPSLSLPPLIPPQTIPPQILSVRRPSHLPPHLPTSLAYLPPTSLPPSLYIPLLSSSSLQHTIHIPIHPRTSTCQSWLLPSSLPPVQRP